MKRVAHPILPPPLIKNVVKLLSLISPLRSILIVKYTLQYQNNIDVIHTFTAAHVLAPLSIHCHCISIYM